METSLTVLGILWLWLRKFDHCKRKLTHTWESWVSKILLSTIAVRCSLSFYSEQLIITVTLPVAFLQFLQIKCATQNYSSEEHNCQHIKLTFVYGVLCGVVWCDAFWFSRLLDLLISGITLEHKAVSQSAVIPLTGSGSNFQTFRPCCVHW